MCLDEDCLFGEGFPNHDDVISTEEEPSQVGRDFILLRARAKVRVLMCTSVYCAARRPQQSSRAYTQCITVLSFVSFCLLSNQLTYL